MSKGKAIPVDIYIDGDLEKIEFNDPSGNHIVDCVWDESDEQNSENRVHFRSWAYRMVEQLGYKVMT